MVSLNPFFATVQAVARPGMMLGGAVGFSDSDATPAYWAAGQLADWTPELWALVARSKGIFALWPLYSILPPARG